MARKAKRRQTARPRRPAQTGAPTAVGQRQQSASTVRLGGDNALVRSVEMSLAPGAAKRGGRVVLDNTDPAIPLDRVPYFISDLKRLGVVAGLMVVLLVLGAEFLVPLVVR